MLANVASPAYSSQMVVSDLSNENAGKFVELDEVNVCCVQRTLSDPLTMSWRDQPADVCVAVDYAGGMGAETALQQILDLVDDSHGRQQVLQELITLGTWFQALMGCSAVNTRLEIMDQKLRCPLYHTDKVSCRLSVSFYGPGTQYLAEENLRRSALLPWSRNGKTLAEINAAVERPNTVHQVSVCASMPLLCLLVVCWSFSDAGVWMLAHGGEVSFRNPACLTLDLCFAGGRRRRGSCDERGSVAASQGPILIQAIQALSRPGCCTQVPAIRGPASAAHDGPAVAKHPQTHFVLL